MSTWVPAFRRAAPEGASLEDVRPSPSGVGAAGMSRQSRQDARRHSCGIDRANAETASGSPWKSGGGPGGGPSSPGRSRSRSQSRSRAGGTHASGPLRSSSLVVPEELEPLPAAARGCFRDPADVMEDGMSRELAARLGYLQMWASLGLVGANGIDVSDTQARASIGPAGAQGLGGRALSPLPEAVGGEAGPRDPGVRGEWDGGVITWDFAGEAIAENSAASLGRLVRTTECTVRYRQARAELLETHASMGDAIMVRHLGFKSRVDPESGKIVAAGDAADSGDDGVCAGGRGGRLPLYAKGLDGGRYAESLRGVRVAWLPNDFPYAFEEGIAHHIIWSTEQLSATELDAVIKAEVPGHETQWWVNPPALQSVRSLWHAHVLSRAMRSSES